MTGRMCSVKPPEGVKFKKGDIRAVNAGKIGGAKRTARKKIAAKIRFLKDRNQKLDNKDIEKILMRLEDPDLNLADMESYLEEHKDMFKPGAYIQTRNLLHKTMHGEKHINKNLNVNIDVELEDVAQHLSKF